VLVVPLLVVPVVADVLLAVFVAPVLVADVLLVVPLPAFGPSPPEFVPQANDANAIQAHIENRARSGIRTSTHSGRSSRIGSSESEAPPDRQLE
jgi:hypothetical protein